MTEEDFTAPRTLRWTWMVRDMVLQERWQHHVLFLIAAHADARNVAKPGLRSLSDRVGISVNQVSRFLGACHLAGLLVRDARKGFKSGHGHQTNAYTLAFPKFEDFQNGTIHVLVPEGKRTYAFTFHLPGPAERYVTPETVGADYFPDDYVPADLREELEGVVL